MREYPHTNGRLLIDGVDPHEVIKQAGTPVWIYEQRRIEANYKRLRDAFSKHIPNLRVHYAMKANSALAVLRILEMQGAYIDAVTWNEAQLAMLAGFPAKRILFTGVNVDNESLEAAAKVEPTVTFDSVSQMDRMAKIRRTLDVAIRVNPEVGAGLHAKTTTGHKGSKFGVPADDARSEEHTSELQSQFHLVCRLLLEKKKKKKNKITIKKKKKKYNKKKIKKKK